MRIIEFTNALKAGGAEVFVTDLSIQLARKNNEVMLMTYAGVKDARGEQLNRALEINKIQIKHFGLNKTTSKIQVFITILQMVSEIKKFNPDIIHVHLSTSEKLCSLINLLSFFKFKFVRTLHNTHLFVQDHKYISFFFKSSVGCHKDVITARLQNRKIRNACYINNGLRIPNGLFKPKKESKIISFVSVANMMWYPGLKGTDLLIRAFSKIKNSYIRLSLIGYGSAQMEFENLVKSLGCADRIVFEGIKTDIYSELSKHDAFILPSKAEGLPISALEAAITGLPLITSDIPAFDIFESSSKIKCFTNDIGSIKTSIKTFIKNREKYKTAGRINIKKYASLFSVKICADKYIRLFKDLLSNDFKSLDFYNSSSSENKIIKFDQTNLREKLNGSNKAPNFFIIGAPKCGTTALSEYLKMHQNIFISTPKEPHFFNLEFSKIGKMRKSTYLSLFSKVNPDVHKAIGEASTGYLFSKIAVLEILKFNPNAKFIVMLRNPIDLVQALHSTMLYLGIENIQNFEEAWNAQKDRKDGKRIPLFCFEPKALMYSEWGKLGDQVGRLFSIVKRENVKVIVFDDFIADTRKTYEEVLSFLNVPSDGRKIFPKKNENKEIVLSWLQPFLSIPAKLAKVMRIVIGFPKNAEMFLKLLSINSRLSRRQPISGILQSELDAFYRDDVLKLSKLLNRDLSYWISPRALYSMSRNKLKNKKYRLLHNKRDHSRTGLSLE